VNFTVNRGRLLATSILAGATLFSVAPAFAQESSEGADEQEIFVTGSRIARQDLVANSPIQTVTSEQIEASGDLNTEEFLNALPQIVPGLSAASNNPSNGTATVDLRGLGASRTLVLIDGRRMVPAERGSVVDLNTIPTGLIERVEVVTGGASAVYGSDALGGVVNFRLKRDFEGLELSTQYGITAENDGEQFNMSAIFGANSPDGKGNVTGFVSYYDRNEILSTARANWAIPNSAGGSATGIAGRIDNIFTNPTPSTAVAVNCPVGGTSRNLVQRPTATTGFCNNFDLTAVGDRYDFSPVNLVMSPQERISMALMGQYEISRFAKFYGEVFYTDSRNAAQLAPTPATGIVVPVNNAFITPATAAILAGRPTPGADITVRRRMVEVGARQETRNSDSYQINLGFKGDIGDVDWNYDVYAGHGRTEFNAGIRNDVSRSRLAAATAGGPGATTTTCATAVLSLFPGCVPVNLFGEGSITPAAANFIRLNFDDETVFERDVVSASVSGPLFQLPAGALAVAFGAEYRSDELTYTPDAAKAAADIFGFNSEKPVAGSTSVIEVFAEALVPLVEGAPGVDYLGLELGVRYSDYDTVGGITTWKAGGEYQPFDGLRFRGMYQVANRAPNVFELFQANDQGFPGVADPCATIRPAPFSSGPVPASILALCSGTSAVGLGFNPNTTPGGFTQTNVQIEAFFFGNPNLQEEQSDTYTLGVVWEPDFVDNLSFTLDYYNISIEDYVGAREGGTTGIVTACYASGSATSPQCFDPTFGALVFRRPTGELQARAPLDNVSALETSGVDFTAAYELPLSWASLPAWMGESVSLATSITYLNSYELDGIEYKDTVGSVNISAALPEWKANFRVGYDLGPVSLNYSATYIDEMQDQGDLPAFAASFGTGVVTESYTYHDVSASWAVNDTLELFGGVKNLLDKDPPLLGNAPDGNTDPNTYDVLGRNFFVGARARF
jgi:iron complex outermembrane recepter protein